MKAELAPTVGPYRLERALVERASGTLYRARTPEDPASPAVALEIVRPERDHRDLAERVRGARPNLECLTHPSIVPLLDAQRTPTGGTYVVMGAVDGLPLVEYARRHGLGPTQRVAMVQGVCHALQHAHTRGVYHGSLSARDVLVSAEGMPKVVGVGIPSIEEPPGGHDVAERADLRAIARLTHELLTERSADSGTPLFAEEDEVSGDLRAVVVTALGERPGRNYADVEQLSRDLSRVQRGRPVLARERSLLARVVHLVKRRWIRLASSS